MPNRTRSKLNLLAAATLVLACGVSSTSAFGQATSTETATPVIDQPQNAAPAATPPASAVEGEQPATSQPSVAQPLVQAQPVASGVTVPGAEPGAQTPSASTETPAAVETPAAEAVEAPLELSANPVLPHDLSPMGMFLAADMVVKAVMIGLALASVITWAIFVVKTLELFAAKARLGRAVRQLSAANGLSELKSTFDGKSGPAAEMVAAAIDEMVRSEAVLDHAPAAGLKERVASLLTRIEVRAGKRMTSGTGILASIGSVGPFVGLFGTVWGIMNSFIGISKAQTTNLAIVAPGIAEALLATAIGLVAAIPAVIIYNYFARSVGGYKVVLADAAAAVERLVSRDLDHRLVRKAQPRRQEGFAHPAEASIARIG
ncbi:tonB-system energizer ExbB [Ensifer sp.]|uniref:tonB-system energizer ExbB n=1 Tax=Ensifer sp. TaxID=1872086 RepID=UPI0028994FE9|nr:tonB-system energizer ExbB [Ensifer sp.]